MTINGEPVCEIDIRASYLTIFHALYDEPFDPTNDPYKVAGLGPEARDVVKMWITASFGNNAPITKWPTELVAKYREVPSLAVHDSLIVPLSRWHETVIDLAHWYRRVSNRWPVLIPHFPEGHEVPAFKKNQRTIGSGYITLSNDPEPQPYDPDDPLDARNF